MAGPIITREISAETRQRVHHACNNTGCAMTSRMLTRPSGPTANPKRITIHGMLRQRSRAPMTPVTPSARYAAAPSAASGIGSTLDRTECKTSALPVPKKGSQTSET